MYVCMYIYIYIYIYTYPLVDDEVAVALEGKVRRPPRRVERATASFHNFKSQNFKLRYYIYIYR